MLGIPEIDDNYCLEGSKIKIGLKCFGMLCFALEENHSKPSP